MSFEETSRDVCVNHPGDVIDKNIESFLEHIRLFALLNSCVEETLDVAKRVLIHGINTGEISDDEVQDGAADGNRAVLITRVIDLLLDNYSGSDTLINFLGSLL